MTNNSPLRVCYFGTYRENYSRNQMMIAGLRLNGVIVTECHQTLWHGIEDRVRVVSGEWKRPSFWWRMLSVYCQLIKSYLRMGDYDILVIGYPGQFDIFLARILTWLKHRPLVWDIFMSIYLISVERGLDKESKLAINLLHFVERIALKLPDLLILDTSEYVQWFTQNYGVQTERFRLVPTGADDRIFTPLPQKTAQDGKFRIVYYGTYIPNHGVLHITDAARLLKNEPMIEFELIGEGPELVKAQQFALENQLTNINFINWMEKDRLIQEIARADICLGAFGTTAQSLMTIQNKIYESLAMKKALISGDSPAIRHEFTHGEHIYLCERANGRALADAIMVLWKDPILREKIAINGFMLFREKYDLLNNGKRFKAYIQEFVR